MLDLLVHNATLPELLSMTGAPDAEAAFLHLIDAADDPRGGVGADPAPARPRHTLSRRGGHA